MLVVLALGCGAPKDAAMADVKGFKDIELGASKADIDGLKELPEADQDQPGVRKYRRKGEEKTLGDAKIDSVTYSFLDDQLVGIDVWAFEDDNCQVFDEMLSAKYEKDFGTRRRMRSDTVEMSWTWMLGKCVLDFKLTSAQKAIRDAAKAEEDALKAKRKEQAEGL